MDLCFVQLAGDLCSWFSPVPLICHWTSVLILLFVFIISEYYLIRWICFMSSLLGNVASSLDGPGVLGRLHIRHQNRRVREKYICIFKADLLKIRVAPIWKGRRGSHRNFWKEPLTGTKILFCGLGLNFFSPLRYRFLHTNTLSTQSYFSAQYAKSARAVDLLKLNTLRGNKSTFLTPKSYDKHSRPIYMGVLPPTSSRASCTEFVYYKPARN